MNAFLVKPPKIGGSVVQFRLNLDHRRRTGVIENGNDAAG